MTLWSSPHPKESTALNLGQGVDGGKIKELVEPGTVMPSSATSFASDSSEDAGFEEGSIDVDMADGEEETEGIQIDCIQTLTEFEPINDGDYRGGNSPVMSDYKTAIPLPPPPMHIGSAFGGNQAYGNIQNTLPRVIDRPSSPMQTSYYYSSGNNTGDSGVHSSRAPGDVGLSNIGNTCFMNSGLQCLLHTSPLVDFFVGRNSSEQSNTSLVYQFHSLMSHVWFGNKGAISPHDFKLVLGNNYMQFKDCRQHDCQEFLAVLLDLLHEEMKLKHKPALSIADSSVGQSYVEDCTDSDNVVGSHDDGDQKGSPSNTAESTSSEDKEDAKNISRPSSKRLKLENHSSVGTDSGVEKTDESSEDNEVKRKSPLPRQENNSIPSDASDIDMNNVQENQVDGGNHVEDNSETQNVTSNSNTCPVQKAKDSWDTYMKDNNTVIASTFQGMFKSAVTCSECNYVSELYEPFMYLSLPIPRVMEKQFNVTLISLKDRNHMKIEITHHLMGTVSQLIQAVVKKANSCGGLDVQTKYAAAEVFNHRISRILDDKMQLRNVTTNSRNIYIYELNDNFNDSNESSYILDIPPTLESCNIMSSGSGQQQAKSSNTLNCDRDESCERQDASTSASSTSTYGPVGAPVGGGFYDISSSSITHGPNAEDDLPQIDNEKFNQVQCNICLEDYSRSELKKHVGCSCVLCEMCLNKSVEHFQVEAKDTAQQGSLLRCAVCLQTVDCKRTFVSLSESLTPSAHAELITMSVIFRSEAATDANNNSSWSPNLFGYPLLIRVPSFVNATEFVDFIQTINPAPEVNHRLLSVKSDGKSCGQCVLSTRCSGCEIPREGMISLNSCNSILISFVDLPSERKDQLQPTDMAIQNELSQSWSYNRNEEPSIDIHDCLRTFSETEHLDEQNPWYCPRCEKNQRATKALSICKFPDYLIVYLKRFVFLDQSSNKLNNRLTFPINDLDVSEYVTEGFGADIGKYNLYSCVCHFGSASSGHYTAFAKNPVTSQWHYFNDDSISERVPGDGEYSSAYVLFYEKQGMDCNIPSKCNRPLPPLNSFNITSTDTRGSYLPGESTVSAGPVRVGEDFGNEMNLQVDSTSDFSFPHSSTEADIMGLEVDEGVGTETTPLVEIRDGLGLGIEDAVMVSSSTPGVENEVVEENEITSNNLNCSDNTISTSNQNEKASSSAASADSTSN